MMRPANPGSIEYSAKAARHLLVLLLGMTAPLRAQVVHELEPTADSFVRQNAPNNNYGGAGALNVSGESATNPFGTPNGRFDTVIKFDTTAAVQAFNAAFGPGGWTLSSVTLTLSEVPNPNHPVFNVGAGTFEVRWLSSDNWTEGFGTPIFIQIASGTVISWNYLQTLLSAGMESPLGNFANTLTDTMHVYSLTLDPAFVSDIAAAGPVTLHLAPVTPTIGFTFNSRNYFLSNRHPRLTITATSAGGVPGDLDGDGDVDLADYAMFRACLNGPAGGLPGGCDTADLDDDGDADLLDFAIFGNNFTG